MVSRFPYVPFLGFLLKDRFRSDLRIGSLRIPKLFLIAGQDRVIPPVHAARLFYFAAEPKEIRKFRNAGHNDLYDHGAFETVAAFMRKL